MDFSFNAKTFRSIFQNTMDGYLQNTPVSDDENSPQQLTAAMMQAIDVMERADADAAASGQQPTGSIGDKDISQIGDYALTLIEGLVGHMQSGSGEIQPGEPESGPADRELMRLTVPVTLWIAKHGGKIEQRHRAVS
jgi:hypothetical protein